MSPYLASGFLLLSFAAREASGQFFRGRQFGRQIGGGAAGSNSGEECGSGQYTHFELVTGQVGLAYYHTIKHFSLENVIFISPYVSCVLSTFNFSFMLFLQIDFFSFMLFFVKTVFLNNRSRLYFKKMNCTLNYCLGVHSPRWHAGLPARHPHVDRLYRPVQEQCLLQGCKFWDWSLRPVFIICQRIPR